MSDNSALQVEVQQLRQQVEEYRAREIETLQSQLAEARAAAQHYKAEAERNAQLGHQIHRESQETITKLQTKLSVLENLRGRHNTT